MNATTAQTHATLNVVDSIAERCDEAACRRLGIPLYRSYDRKGNEIWVTIPEDEN